MEYVEIIISMLFMHFLFDYYIQSKSNKKIKDKKWWKSRHPNNEKKVIMCYLFGLMFHSFVWSYAVLIPILYKTGHVQIPLIIINTIIHGIIDNLKTNTKSISSLTDQALHCLQIFISFCIMVIGGII